MNNGNRMMGTEYVSNDNNNGIQKQEEFKNNENLKSKLNDGRVQAPNSSLHKHQGYTKDALPGLGNKNNANISNAGFKKPASSSKDSAGNGNVRNRNSALQKAQMDNISKNNPNSNKSMKDRIASTALRTMGLPKSVADSAVEANKQKANAKGIGGGPLNTNLFNTVKEKTSDGGGSFQLSGVLKKILLASGVGTTFMFTVMIFITTFIVYTTLQSVTNNADKAMEESSDKIEGRFDNMSDDDIEKNVNKASNKQVSYINVNLGTSVLNIKLGRANVLAKAKPKSALEEFNLNLDTINELYPPSKEYNNSKYAAAFYYKLNSLNEYYKNLCGKQVLDIPLLMITLKLETDDMAQLFISNLGYINEESLNIATLDKMFNEYYDYYYDWSNYNITKNSSLHDMEILAQHMVDVKGIKYCTYDEERYKEYLKEFIDKKYYSSTGLNEDYMYSSSSSNFFPRYNLTEDQIVQIASLCAQEQGHSNPRGAAAEAALMANKFEVSGAKYAAKYANNGDALYHYVREVGWWHAAGTYMDKRNAKPEIVAAVRDVLVNGNRVLPKYVDSHDCTNCGKFNKCPNGDNGDICELVINGASYTEKKDIENKKNYIAHKTRVKNVYGIKSKSYQGAIFYSFPSSAGDPFSYKNPKLREKYGDCHYDVDSGMFVECVDFNDLLVKWLVNIAEDDSHGYSQTQRNSLIDFDCSSLVYYGLLNSGFTTNELGTTPFTTRTEQNILKKNGFSEIKIEPGVTLQKGDILWTDGRTEVYIGANMTVGAHQASNGGPSDGQYGDQDGSEIAVVNMAQGNYWQYIYRYER